jgi:hypothetical protein
MKLAESSMYIFEGIKDVNEAIRLARDVIHDITDGRRHVGGIFLAPRGTF